MESGRYDGVNRGYYFQGVMKRALSHKRLTVSTRPTPTTRVWLKETNRQAHYALAGFSMCALTPVGWHRSLVCNRRDRILSALRLSPSISEGVSEGKTHFEISPFRKRRHILPFLVIVGTERRDGFRFTN